MSDTPGQRPDGPPDRPADATSPLPTAEHRAAADTPATDTPPPAEQPPATPPPAAPAPVAGEPAEPGRFRRFAGARATQLVAAGLVGLLVGGLAVGLIEGRDHRDGGPAAVREYRGPGGPAGPGDRGPRFERDFRGGPDRELPRRGDGESQPG